jgi:hypothetical protein
MGMLIYDILRGLCLVIEWNAIINMQNNMVKKHPEPDKKKIPLIFALEKPGHCSWYQST